jgi:hypothetical protein
MRAGTCTILGIGAILITAPAWAAGGRYDPDYPVCMEAIASESSIIDCSYTSIEQCRIGTSGTSGNCFKNPRYVPRPGDAAPAQTEVPLGTKSGKSAGRYDPDYPVCMEAISSEGVRIDCMYTSLEQCRQGTFGSSGNCFKNPSYVPRPAEAAPAQTEPTAAARPGKSAGRYDPDYPVCMEAYGMDGSRIECLFTSMEQCKLGTSGTSGTCFKNPSYAPPPANAAAATQTEPAPPAKPAKPTKSAKATKPPQSPPSPQPAQLQR